MFKPAFDIVVNRINPLKSQLNAQSERHQIHTPKATSLSIKCTFQVEKIEQKNKQGKFAKLGHVCEKCKPGVFFVAAIYINASDVGSHKALVFQQSDAIIKIHSLHVSVIAPVQTWLSRMGKMGCYSTSKFVTENQRRENYSETCPVVLVTTNFWVLGHQLNGMLEEF